MYRIGIDVGGTFTDLVAVDEQGRVTLAKAASTPEDQSLGVMDGLDRLAEALSLDRPTLLARTQIVVHGTTVATNALIEHKGARVGLLTTQGHRDIVEMREGLKDDRYNLRQPPPVQLVPRQLRHGVRERPDGRTEIALDPASLENAIAALARAGVEAVAVCYLHSWRDDTHERATVEALRAALPDVYVCRSSQVLPQIKEYDRVCTTIVDAYVGPVLERYLTRLASRLGEAGFSGPVLIIQSHGGVSTIADAVRLAAAASCPVPPVASPAAVMPRDSCSTAISSPSTWAAPRPTSRSSSAARQPSPPTAASPASVSPCRAWTLPASAPAVVR